MTTADFRQAFRQQLLRVMPLHKRIQRDLPPHFSKVKAAEGQVDLAMKEIEERFLQIATTLENITTTGRELVTHCESLISLALGQGGGEIMIDEAAQHIWRAVEFVENNDRNMEQLIRQLTTSSERINQTLSTEQNLVRTLAPLNFVKTLFRVESASLPVDVQEMFYALAREIDRIRLRVEGGFREKFQLIREIQAILSKAIVHLQAQQAQAKNSVAGLRQHMATSLAAMKDSYEKNRDRDTRLSGVSQSVQQETGRVVLSLQYQDIITQKLQHVRKVLEEMDECFANLSGDRVTMGRSLHFIGKSGRIAGAQLNALQDELTNAGSTICDGLHQITQQMEALDTNVLALRDLDTVTTGVDGAVQILLDSLADVQRLMREADAHAMESHQTIEPIGGMTTNFTGFMRELSLEIQLIGLNAEVQAAHVGQGTGLEVLSAHTSAISRETSKLSEALAGELDTLTAGLDQVVAGFKDIREENKKFASELDCEFGKDTVSLHDYRDSALKVLIRISELLPQLNNLTEGALEQANFSSVVTEPIAVLRSAVVELSQAAESTALTIGVEIDIKDLVDHHRSRYTMQSEVDIHNQAASGAPISAQLPAAITRQGPDIELFDVTPVASGKPQPPASPALSKQETHAAHDVDLWDDIPPNASPGSNQRG